MFIGLFLWPLLVLLGVAVFLRTDAVTKIVYSIVAATLLAYSGTWLLIDGDGLGGSVEVGLAAILCAVIPVQWSKHRKERRASREA
jgi:hypothetical protein